MTRSADDEGERLWTWACQRAGVDPDFPATATAG
jgi:hypothetical protein